MKGLWKENVWQTLTPPYVLLEKQIIVYDTDGNTNINFLNSINTSIMRSDDEKLFQNFKISLKIIL